MTALLRINFRAGLESASHALLAFPPVIDLVQQRGDDIDRQFHIQIEEIDGKQSGQDGGTYANDKENEL